MSVGSHVIACGNDGIVKRHLPLNGDDPVWSFSSGGNTLGVAMSNDKASVYVAATFPHRVIELAADTGEFVREFTGHTSSVRRVKVDSEGFVYSVSNDGTLRKLTPELSQVWSHSLGGTVYDVGIVDDGTFRISSSNGTVRAVSASGGTIWSYSQGNFPSNISVNPQTGFAYIGDNTTSLTVLDSFGDLFSPFPSSRGGIRRSFFKGTSVWTVHNSKWVREIDHLSGIVEREFQVEDDAYLTNWGNAIWVDESDNIAYGGSGVSLYDPSLSRLWHYTLQSLFMHDLVAWAADPPPVPEISGHLRSRRTRFHNDPFS